MEKIPTIFERDWNGDRSRVLDEPVEGCEWVFAGEGEATRKYDGTCCLVRGEKLFKRHEVRPGKATPPGFQSLGTDEATGKTIGWVPVGSGPEDKWHLEAFNVLLGAAAAESGYELPDGTYELVGPKIQGNPEGFEYHHLIHHRRDAERLDAPRDFYGLVEFFETAADVEGIVWHHPDGRMAKIKAKDFGIKRENHSRHTTRGAG